MFLIRVKGPIKMVRGVQSIAELPAEPILHTATGETDENSAFMLVNAEVKCNLVEHFNSPTF